MNCPINLPIKIPRVINVMPYSVSQTKRPMDKAQECVGPRGAHRSRGTAAQGLRSGVGAPINKNILGRACLKNNIIVPPGEMRIKGNSPRIRVHMVFRQYSRKS